MNILKFNSDPYKRTIVTESVIDGNKINLNGALLSSNSEEIGSIKINNIETRGTINLDNYVIRSESGQRGIQMPQSIVINNDSISIPFETAMALPDNMLTVAPIENNNALSNTMQDYMDAIDRLNNELEESRAREDIMRTEINILAGRIATLEENNRK